MIARTFHTTRCSTLIEQDARAARNFNELATQAKVHTKLHLKRSSQTSLGLAASTQTSRFDVLMRVPTSASFVLDYNSGLQLPAAARWPRLRGAASSSGSSSADPLPWDVLQALALLDGLSGDGGDFWQTYCDALLPAPELLTLPMCWERPRLAQLQHADIANAAKSQQARLTSLFPEFMESLAPDVPSWFQWAFACVRSRAFRVGPDAFAFVPFLDFANHAEALANGTTANGSSPLTANADFRLSPATKSTTGGGSDDNGGVSYFELVALRDLAPGEEVTICYCGPEGYTNQRFMAQYGFVPRGGNPADRIKLELEPTGLHSAPLELSRLQDILGDSLFLGALRGSDPYLLAALKSLPLKNDDDDDDDDNYDGKGVNAGGGGGVSMRTAAVLLSQVEAQLAECTTPLEYDEELLSGSSGQQLWAEDPRLAAAVSYRVERKRLLGTGAALLRAYVRQIGSSGKGLGQR